MIVLDTTILIDAVGTDHPLRAPCRSLFELARDGAVRAATTVEAVQEFTQVRARRRSLAEADARAREYGRGLSPIMQPDDGDLFDGLGLFEASRYLSFLLSCSTPSHVTAVVIVTCCCWC
ncbi:MAG: type II toxin-antitoxin system VapC family toxin [Acidimicrobiales bacterium]